MIREFFSPRVALFFFLLWAVCFVASWLWRQLTKKERRKAWNVSRAVASAALVAAFVCAVVVTLLTLLS